MARPRTFDTQIALEKILELVWAHGSNTLSLDEIAKQLQLSKTSLYSAFGNKSALLSQCLDLYETQYERPLLNSFVGGDLNDCIRNFLEFSSKRFASIDSPPGCFMFNCAIESETLSDELQRKVEQQNISFKMSIKQKVIEHLDEPNHLDVDNIIDAILINLFGLASASRMRFPISKNYIKSLDWS